MMFCQKTSSMDNNMVTCYYWFGRVPDTEFAELSTLVVRTSIPIDRNTLKKMYKHIPICLRRVKKDDERLNTTRIIFKNKITKNIITTTEYSKSVILKKILELNDGNADIDGEFQHKCSISRDG